MKRLIYSINPQQLKVTPYLAKKDLKGKNYIEGINVGIHLATEVT